MRYYYVSFTAMGRRSGAVLLRGPTAENVYRHWRVFKERIDGVVGPRPNTLDREFSAWTFKNLAFLKVLHAEYSCRGDYEAVFIEHLVQRCGFERMDCDDVRLG